MTLVLPVFSPLQPNESLNGYLLRRAELNRYESLHVITGLIGAPTGTRNMRVVQKYVPPLADLLEIGEAELRAHLFRYSGMGGSGREAWKIGNHVLSNGMVDLKRPKVCPDCLRETAFVPLEWELTFFTTCPLHRTPLVEQCQACGSRIGWGRHTLHHCKSCGEEFRANCSAAVSQEEVELAELIKAKLHGETAAGGQWPDFVKSLSLNGLLELCLFVGGTWAKMNRLGALFLARLGLAERRGLLAQAASAINTGWPSGLHEFAGRFLSDHAESCRSTTELFPGLYKRIMWRYRREGFSSLIEELGRFVAAHYPDVYARWNGQSALFMESRELLALESVTSIRRRLGLDTKRLDRLARQLDISCVAEQGIGRTRKRLTRTDAKRIEIARRRADLSNICQNNISSPKFKEGRDFPNDVIDTGAILSVPVAVVSKRLNVSESTTIGIMARVDALVSGPASSGRSEGKIIAADRYVEFERRLADLVRAVRGQEPSDQTLGVGTAVKNRLRRYDVDLGSMLEALMDGDLALAGFAPEARGIDRLLIFEHDVNRIASTSRQAAFGQNLDAREAKEFLKLPRMNVIYELRRAGHLDGRQKGARGGGSIIFDREELEGFRQRYVTLSELMTWADTEICLKGSAATKKALERMGLKPEFELTAHGKRTPFFCRQTCLSALTDA